MIRLALRVPRERAEVVLAELLDLAPSGVEEVDHGASIEYAVYGAPGELPAMPDLRAVVGDACFEVSTSEVPDDWEAAWKAFHRPVLVEERLHVRPPWCDPVGTPGVIEIVIDPAQAFGTGAHHTTRMCLELLLELEPRGELSDLGSGSGVLAVAAAKLGWNPVSGHDYDPLSVTATRGNAEYNGVKVDATRWDLRDDPIPVAPTITANLLGPLLVTVAARIRTPPRNLIASGLLRTEADAVVGAFAAKGMGEAQRLESGEWAALMLTTIPA